MATELKDRAGERKSLAGEKNFITKDSGQRAAFASGSVRDTEAGKGAFDLLPFDILADVAGVMSTLRRTTTIAECWSAALQESLDVGMALWAQKRTDATSHLVCAAGYGLLAIECRDTGQVSGCESRSGLAKIPYIGIKRVAELYARGAIKYQRNNWCRVQPASRTFSSMLRHGWQAASGMEDEDHASGFVWNAFALLAYIKRDQIDNSMDNEWVGIKYQHEKDSTTNSENK